MGIFGKLVAPVKYLKIKHREKRYVDVCAPAISAAIVCAVILFAPKPISLLSEDGIVKTLSAFLQFLVGFYVAALAAIATFPNKNMDVPTDGIPLKLDGVTITRRQYLSYLFGYLAFVGLGVVLFSSAILTLESNIEYLAKDLEKLYVHVIKGIVAYVYFYFVSSVLFITLYGLYYLTEKIHEDNAEFVGKIGGVSKNEED